MTWRVGISDGRWHLIVCRAINRLKTDAVAWLDQKRLATDRIKEDQSRAADNLPAAGSLGGIDTGLSTGDSNRTSRHVRSWRRTARCRNAIVDGSQVGESGDEAEHEHAVRALCVNPHHFVLAQ